MPFGAIHPVVAVEIEVRKSIAAVIVQVSRNQKLVQSQLVVTIAVGADEVLDVIPAPFESRDASIAVAIQGRELLARPGAKRRGVIRRTISRPRCARSDLVTGQASVAVPVMDGKRLGAATPLCPADHTVVVSIHAGESN